MPEIQPLGPHSVSQSRRTSTGGHRKDASETRQPDAPQGRTNDRVELSSDARHLDRLRRLTGVRQDRVSEVRQSIADGTYESEEKLQIAVERLLEELDR